MTEYLAIYLAGVAVMFGYHFYQLLKMELKEIPLWSKIVWWTMTGIIGLFLSSTSWLGVGYLIAEKKNGL